MPCRLNRKYESSKVIILHISACSIIGIYITCIDHVIVIIMVKQYDIYLQCNSNMVTQINIHLQCDRHMVIKSIWSNTEYYWIGQTCVCHMVKRHTPCICNVTIILIYRLASIIWLYRITCIYNVIVKWYTEYCALTI